MFPCYSKQLRLQEVTEEKVPCRDEGPTKIGDQERMDAFPELAWPPTLLIRVPGKEVAGRDEEEGNRDTANP